MSRIRFVLLMLLVGWPLLAAQENERRRVIRSEESWPGFDLALHGQGVQIALQGLGHLEVDSSARAELAMGVAKSMFAAENLNAAGGWLKQEPSINLSCTVWARLALAAARKEDREVWKRAKEEVERLAPIGSQREGRAGWVLLYESALLVDPEDAGRYLRKIPSDDFESQVDLKVMKIRRIGGGLEATVEEEELIKQLVPPPTQASLDLMVYALKLVEALRGGASNNGRDIFSAVARQAVKCAMESAANPAPVLVAVLTEAERRGKSEPLMDEWFEKATRFVAMANLDEDMPSYLLKMARVAERRGDLERQKRFLEAGEKSLQGLEPALQPEGYLRLGRTHVEQGEAALAWQVWKELLLQLKHNPNRDLRIRICGEIALEIDSWTGDVAELKRSALAEVEACLSHTE